MLDGETITKSPMRKPVALKGFESGPSPERPHWRCENPFPGQYVIVAEHGPSHPDLMSGLMLRAALQEHPPHLTPEQVLAIEGEKAIWNMIAELAVARQKRERGEACPCGDCH